MTLLTRTGRAQRITTRFLAALVSATVMLLSMGAILPETAQAASSSNGKKVIKKKSSKKRTAKKSLVIAPTIPLLAATSAQLQAANNVLVGNYACEFGKTMRIQPHPEANGYFTLTLGSKAWVMAPHLTPTGTTRLEDIEGNTLLLQILTKSMLMDSRAGRRLVDGCVHATQHAAEIQLLAHPRASNF